MDNLVIGLIVVLALAYIGNKFYKQMSGKGGCGCGGGSSKSGSKKSSGTEDQRLRHRDGP